MTFMYRHAVTAGALAVLLACSSSSSSSSGTGSLSVTASPTTAVADGTSTVTIHVAGTAKAPISIVTSKGSFAGQSSATYQATPFDAVLQTCDSSKDSSCAGDAIVRAQDANGVSGSAIVVLTALSGGTDGGTDGGSDGGTDAGSDGGTSGTTQLGSLSLLSQGYEIQGVRFSGFQEVNNLTFQVLDATGQPYVAGLTVNFTHTSLGGSFIGASSSCTNANPSICSASAVTDSSGQVTVPLASGTVAGVVAVTASATLGGITITDTASGIAIVGAKASGSHISIECTPKNVPALAADRTCLTTYYDGVITCTAYFADRFNNVIGVPLLATFASEAGSPGLPVLTAAYDPKTTTDQTSKLGFAVETVAVAGYPLPVDVAPVGSEPSSTVTNDPCGTGASFTRIHNPRDGLVTIIVMARGEEGFVDLNGNGVWDAGEPFIDLGEPFVDANDNDLHDSGEWFLDANSNGVWDGPNGKWDSDTTIWAATRVVYTGLPAAQTAASPGSYVTNVNPVDGSGNLALSLAALTDGTFTFVFQDENMNQLSPSFTSYTPLSETGNSTPKVLFSPANVDNLGMGFEQQYCQEKAPTAAATCSNICPSAPCYVRTFVGPYPKGSVGVASAIPSKVGFDAIDIEPTVNKITVAPGVRQPVAVSQ